MTQCLSKTQCLKITEKVSFNIASEASYVYILNGQKFIKNAKNSQFWRVFKNWNWLSNSVTRQVELSFFDEIQISGQNDLELQDFPDYFAHTPLFPPGEYFPSNLNLGHTK